MSKFDFRSLKTIIIAPGDITYNFINGRQVSLVTPIVIFIIANVLYFGAPRESDFYVQMNNRPYSDYSKDMAGKKIKEDVYIQRWWWISRASLVFVPFIFSLPLYFINYRKALKYIDHLAASFEVSALTTLYLLTGMAWLNVPVFTLIAGFLLFYAFERMAYRWRPFRAMGNAALLVVLFYGTMLIYRTTVFFITMLTL